jgi:hypothetical protein
MVKVYSPRRCFACKAPLNVTMRLTPREYDLIHEFSSVNPLDMTRNKVIYKVSDLKAFPLCNVCYRHAKQPVYQYVRDREIGFRNRHIRYCTTRSALSSDELIDWVEGFKKYMKDSDMASAPPDYHDSMFLFPASVPCISGMGISISYHT